ncbi:hypothetical protein N7474_008453 [Penicillium riverlandense]|uniref:uncharacterized protein n=1 Tax=Penicillium riverlandense TaxID=1903569 RepID=UPI0025473923|nr:uncharacterized protein N7474_008453 [Penicillium riverlandense]KAJ5812152.1 hypothetical protein N7474_008453 [Penicillium riverlandense]
MLCLRCRALPAVRPSMPSRSLNRTTQGASQNSPITPIISSRSFSSTLFSTPTHLLQPTPQISTSSHIMSSRLPSTAIPSVSSSLSLSPVTSLLQSQSRAFSSTPTPRRAPLYLQSFTPGAETTAWIPVAVQDEEWAEGYPAPEVEGEEKYELVNCELFIERGIVDVDAEVLS